MKKATAVGLCVLMSVWCFSSARAVVTHLEVDFSGYTLGDVKGQSGSVSGDWIGGDYWTGTVVPVSGTQALEVFSTAGSSSATRRGSVPLGSSLSLASADKIYMSLDLYGKDPGGDLDIMLSTGSVGTIANLGFGLWYNGTGDGIKFTSSTAGGSLVRKDTAFMLTEDTWTRFEYEITQSAVAGVGIFSVYVSNEGGGARTAIFEDEAYSFTMTSLATLNVAPIAVGTAANAVAINNLAIQSGLVDFPVNPIDEPGSIATHLKVDFSGYTLGNVEGQSGTVSGNWVGGAYWTGTVVSVSGTQALEVFSAAGSSSATRRGNVPLGSSLSLESADKIYMSLDVYGKDPDGDLDIILSTGSFGSPANLGFGIWYNGTDDGIKFATSTTNGLVRKDTAFMLTEDTWTRFEYEITQSAVAGVGTFSVFVSTEGGGSRSAIFEDEAYAFTMTSLATLNVVPIAIGTAENAVAIDNLTIQSGLVDFPVNPIDEPVTTIISLSQFSGNILEMVVDCPTPSTSYPKIKTDLVTGSWGSVGHSTSSGGPFTTNNLGTVSGAITIYLEANDVAAFYGIGEE